MQERRKYLRFNTPGSVVLKRGDGTPAIINTELLNISFDGFSVFTPEKIEIGNDVNFELSIKLWNEIIIGEGKVRYMHGTKNPKEGFRIGVEFGNIDRKVIQNIINHIQAEICSEARRKDISRRRGL